jgi:hypothetical protein
MRGVEQDKTTAIRLNLDLSMVACSAWSSVEGSWHRLGPM